VTDTLNLLKSTKANFGRDVLYKVHFHNLRNPLSTSPKLQYRSTSVYTTHAHHLPSAKWSLSIMCFPHVLSLSFCLDDWLFKGLRLTAGRRPTWVCGAYAYVGLGGAYIEQS